MSGISVLLAVDDNPDNLFVLEQLIAQYCPECRIIKAVNADMGLEIARSQMPDVALVDVQMPGMDGIEMCRRLKADPETARIPVILLTAHQTTSSRKVMGLEAGADDFITKPVDSIELIARINVMRRIRAAEDELRREKNSLTKTVSRQFTQLKDAEKDYYALFNSASDAFFIQDLDGRFLEVNDEAVNRLGYSREQFARMFPKDINPPESADRFSERMKQLLEKGQIIFETFHLPRNAPPIPTEVSARFIEYRGRQAILSIARDLRERKQAEAERGRLHYQLQQAQKHQALGTLAGGIAHDFNNILAPIIGYAEMGLAEVSEESPLHRNMVEILRAAERASKLVGQILIFSRSDSQERKPIRIQLVIREALKLIRATIPPTIRIHQQIDENCGAVLADPTQTHQIIMNLCTNAWHAMEEGGGEVRISLSEVFIGPGSHIERLSRSPGRYLRLIVSDTGHGMTPTVRERIFDPYFTTKEKGKGTGLGLAVVQGIVHSYDGEITVFSRPGIGTTFSIYLPRFESKTEPVTDEIVQTGTPPCGNERILLVDDEEQVAVIECQLLESLGYQVTAMTSSQDALSLFRKQPEAFDLVITDHAMPGMGGIELAGKIIAIRQEMPVLLCTGFGDMATVEKSKTAGVRAFMKKPVSRKELAISVRNILDGAETLYT